MNVYDFDGTILDGDTEDYFFDFLYREEKRLRPYVLRYRLWNRIMELFSPEDKTWIRSHQYRVLRKIPDLDGLLERFWAAHRQHIKAWYLRAQQPEDIIASATPRFLLEPMMRELGITRLTATEMDPRTGTISGHFASGKYKPENFRKDFGNPRIDRFYSDTYSDRFMAALARESWVVHDYDRLSPWDSWWKDRKN